MITAETLRKFAPKIKDPEIHAGALETARKKSSVTTSRRLCHFMGQIFVETGGFTAMEENLNYKDPERLDAIFSAVKGIEDARALILSGPSAIANRVYARLRNRKNEGFQNGINVGSSFPNVSIGNPEGFDSKRNTKNWIPDKRFLE